jgi:prevent-host-death family protein
MARQVNIAEAKAKLSELADAASRGEEIVLARNGKPLARLLPIEAGRHPGRRLGALKDLLSEKEIAALKRAIEKPLSKADAAAMRGEASDAFGISIPRSKIRRSPR